MSRLLSPKSAKILLLTDRVDRLYFSGEDFAEGVVIVSANFCYYFADSRYYHAVVEKFKNSQVQVELLNENAIKTFFESKNIKTVWVNYQKTTVSEYNGYKKLGVKVKDASEYINQMRWVKSLGELNKIKKACEIITEALDAVLPTIKVGDSENQVRQRIVENIKRLGGGGESFESIVAFGKNSAIPHHQTGETLLQEESVVLIDTGAVYQGYCSDITRTYYFGKNPSEEFLQVYKAVLTANQLAIEKASASLTGKQLDGVAREYLESKGYGKNFTHSLGHGVGLEIHEGLSLSPKCEKRIKNSTAFTIEPGVYLAQKFGVRIEDTVIMRGKAKVQTKLEKNLKFL